LMIELRWKTFPDRQAKERLKMLARRMSRYSAFGGPSLISLFSRSHLEHNEVQLSVVIWISAFIKGSEKSVLGLSLLLKRLFGRKQISQLDTSLPSQALAARHSRIIVIGASFITSAVSSTVKPPKNLSSTI